MLHTTASGGRAQPTCRCGCPASLLASQLPSALQLPLTAAPSQQPQQPPEAAAAAADSSAAGLAAALAPQQQLDTAALSAAVPSRLLVSLLVGAAGGDVVGPAADVLSRLDAAAAIKNDYLALFKSQQHFPEVWKTWVILQDCAQ